MDLTRHFNASGIPVFLFVCEYRVLEPLCEHPVKYVIACGKHGAFFVCTEHLASMEAQAQVQQCASRVYFLDLFTEIEGVV